MARVVYEGRLAAVDVPAIGRANVPRGEPIRVNRKIADRLIAQGWVDKTESEGDE